MKHLPFIVAALASISLTMRYLVSIPPTSNATAGPQIQRKTPKGFSEPGDLAYVLGANATPILPPACQLRGPGSRHIVCRLPAEEPLYQKVGPYQSLVELREDLNRRDLWVCNILATPVRRGDQPIGVRISFKSPTPFARLGLQSGDVLLSLNQVITHQVDDLPALLDEMKSSSSLHFEVERKGVLVPLDVQLRRPLIKYPNRPQDQLR